MSLKILIEIILANLALFLILVIVWYVLHIIAAWKIFTKAGEAGWKSIIPIYNLYIQYKISWNTGMFWAAFLGIMIGSMMNSFGGSSVSDIGAVIALAGMVINLIDTHKLSRAFGHGLAFTLGLFFLTPIFKLILGLGSSEYQGPQ